MESRELGIAFVRLGEALQNPKISLKELEDYVADAGLQLEFRFVKQEEDE